MLVKVGPQFLPGKLKIPFLQHVEALNESPQSVRQGNLVPHALPLVLKLMMCPKPAPSSVKDGDLNWVPESGCIVVNSLQPMSKVSSLIQEF